MNEKKNNHCVVGSYFESEKLKKEKKNPHCEHVLVIKRRQAAAFPVKSDFCEII